MIMNLVLWSVVVLFVVTAMTTAVAAGRRTPRRDIGALQATVQRGDGMWAALTSGECCTCGHGWQRGEIIGNVTQAFERDDSGHVWRSPGVRLACAVCVERQRLRGDLSLSWARNAGLL